MKNKLAFTGFMGSGKTTICRVIAEKAKVKFIDLDEYIEVKEKRSIIEIFEEGEDVFRNLETKYLKEILEMPMETVIALGGGTVCFNNNIDLIKKHAWLFALMPSIEQITDNLWKDKNKRPLIKNITTKEDLKKFVELKLNERLPYYNQADWIINF